MKLVNKLGFAPVITMTLLILVSLTTGILVSVWFNQFQSDLKAKNELTENIGKVNLLGLKTYGSSESYLGVRNEGKAYHIISKVEVNGNDCSLLSTNIVETVERIYLNCSVTLNENYNVILYTDKGVFNNIFTVYE